MSTYQQCPNCFSTNIEETTIGTLAGSDDRNTQKCGECGWASGVEFKAGDIVTLKSGGPSMTVAGDAPTRGARAVRCQWFQQCHTGDPDATPVWGRLEEGAFRTDALERVGQLVIRTLKS